MRTARGGSLLEKLLVHLMLAGVALSAACMVIGLALFVTTTSVWFANRVVTVGLIVLMATPGLRVAVAVAEAVRARDWFFVAITGMVVLLLCLTAWFAFRHL